VHVLHLTVERAYDYSVLIIATYESLQNTSSNYFIANHSW